MTGEFICQKCKYRCYLEKKMNKCPYCGDEDSLKEEEKAEELLESV